MVEESCGWISGSNNPTRFCDFQQEAEAVVLAGRRHVTLLLTGKEFDMTHPPLIQYVCNRSVDQKLYVLHDTEP